MGGNAFVIYGTVRDELLQARPARRSFMDKLLGRVPTETPAWTQMGRNLRLMDLPSDALGPMGSAFRRDVAARFDQPWPSTKAMLEYLALDITTVQVRGSATDQQPPEWYVQVTFSGCAGMAELSSEVAAHWAERWYHDNKADIVSRYLEPYGFAPDGRTEPDRSDTIFAPIGEAGYALYSATARELDPEYPESLYFEIDNSVTEMLNNEERSRIFGELDATLPPLLKGKGCCCQWCSPQLAHAAFDRVSPYRSDSAGK